MVKIRLARYGRKKSPFYRIVAINSRKSRNGEALSNLGYFDPLKDICNIRLEEFNKFISQGAQMSSRVKVLYKEFKKISA